MTSTSTTRFTNASLDCTGLSSCNICPRACHADRTSSSLGVCGASENVELALCQLHLWEEPPISGKYGSGTVFFSHCNLNCVYCQNYIISQKSAGRKECFRKCSPDELAQEYLSLERQGAMNINLVTPTHYAPLIRKSISLSKELGLSLPIIWNTSSYEVPSQIRLNEGYVDVYLADMKYASSTLAKAFSSAPDYPYVALTAIETMIESVSPISFDEFLSAERLVSGVIVRHMVLPGHVQNSMDTIKLLYENFGNSIKLSIMNQYTPLIKSRADKGDTFVASVIKSHPELSRRVTDDEYEAVLDYADSLGIEDYYWQEGISSSESFIPNFNVECDGRFK